MADLKFERVATLDLDSDDVKLAICERFGMDPKITHITYSFEGDFTLVSAQAIERTPTQAPPQLAEGRR